MKNLIHYTVTTLRPCLHWLIFGIVLSFVIDIISLLTPVFVGKLIDSFADSATISTITLLVSLIAMTTIFNIAMTHISAIVSLKKYVFHIERFFQLDAMHRVSKFSIGQIQEKNSGEIQSIIGRGTSAFSQITHLVLYDLIPSATYIGAVIGGMFFISWEINIILIIFVSIILISILNVTRTFKDIFNEQQPRWQAVDTQATEYLRNLPLVKMHGAEKSILHEYERSHCAIENDARTTWISYNVKMLYSMQALYVLGVVTLLSVSSYLVLTNTYTPGDFVVIYSWSMTVMTKVTLMRRIFRTISRSLPGIQRFYELIHEEPHIEKFGKEPHIQNGSIQIHNMSHESPSGEKILNNISLEINKGDYVGIIGPSGSGKSTLVNLLMRSHDPTSGTISIDNRPLGDYAETYRRDIAFVEQSPYIFDSSIRYNIQFGSHDLNDDDIWDALKKVHLYDKVKNYSNGLETLVGERGIRLSGGEAQRLIIARALVKKAKIIIFDEATSALDNTTQSELQKTVSQIRQGITTLVIAHRLETVKDCDKIIELNEGNLIAYDIAERVLSI